MKARGLMGKAVRRMIWAGLSLSLIGLCVNLIFALTRPDYRSPATTSAAIIVLGGPDLRSRVDAGIATYHREGAEFFVVSSAGAADFMADRAVHGGVPPAILRRDLQAQSTLQNALFARALLADFDGPVVLVTKRVHLLRAYFSFRWAGFSGVWLQPSDDMTAYRGTGMGAFLTEAVKWPVNLIRAGLASLMHMAGLPRDRYMSLLA